MRTGSTAPMECFSREATAAMNVAAWFLTLLTFATNKWLEGALALAAIATGIAAATKLRRD